MKYEYNKNVYKSNTMLRPDADINPSKFPDYEKRLLDEFSLRFKNFRTLTGLTQKQFADMVSIKQTQLSFYENGVYLPSDEVTKKICNAFNIPYNSFKFNNESAIDIKIENTDTDISRIPTYKGLDYYGYTPFDEQPLTLKINYEYFPKKETATVIEFNAQAYMIYQRLLESDPNTLNIISDFLSKMDCFFDKDKFNNEVNATTEELLEVYSINKKIRKKIQEFENYYRNQNKPINLIPLFVSLGASENKAKLIDDLITADLNLNTKNFNTIERTKLFFEPFFKDASLKTLEKTCLLYVIEDMISLLSDELVDNPVKFLKVEELNSSKYCLDLEKRICDSYAKLYHQYITARMTFFPIQLEKIEVFEKISNIIQDYFILTDVYRNYSITNNNIITRSWCTGEIRFTYININEIEKDINDEYYQ